MHKIFGTKENYVDMLDRIKRLLGDDSVVGSSNFGKFMDCFCREDDSWIKEINQVLE